MIFDRNKQIEFPLRKAYDAARRNVSKVILPNEADEPDEEAKRGTAPDDHACEQEKSDTDADEVEIQPPVGDQEMVEDEDSGPVDSPITGEPPTQLDAADIPEPPNDEPKIA